MSAAVGTRLSLCRPDDWHLHLRDGEVLQAVVGETARHFGRAIVMPNLVPPVVTGADARAYRQRILQARDASSGEPNAARATGSHAVESEAAQAFEPLMTLYLTERTEAADVVGAAAEGLIRAVKLYPAGATTNSDSGVTDIGRVMPVLEAMAEHGIVLCIHGEVTQPEVDIFDREARFIDTVLVPLRARLPELRIVLEHITTAEGVAFVQAQSSNQAGTLTPHHLILDRNHLLAGGIRPHYYCLPVLKRNTHREALLDAASSGDARFFLGTDSAPHHTGLKLAACGCAGVFNSPTTLSCIAQVFDEAGRLEALEGFTSLHGPAFYRLPVNDSVICLEKSDQPVDIPASIQAGPDTITVFDPGRPLYWHVLPPA